MHPPLNSSRVMAPRSRHWCFTYNNPADVHVGGTFTIEGSSYLVYQLEVGELGTPHLQGLVSFGSLKSFQQVRRLFPQGVHIEKMRGTVAQARAYSMKDSTRSPDPAAGPHEFGDIPEGTLMYIWRTYAFRTFFVMFAIVVEQIIETLF